MSNGQINWNWSDFGAIGAGLAGLMAAVFRRGASKHYVNNEVHNATITLLARMAVAESEVQMLHELPERVAVVETQYSEIIRRFDRLENKIDSIRDRQGAS